MQQTITESVAPSANLRVGADPGFAFVGSVAVGDRLDIHGIRSGGAWSIVAPLPAAGTTWYRVVAVNGVSVAKLFGLPYAYVATGAVRMVGTGLETMVLLAS